jgi:hypothetical protein
MVMTKKEVNRHLNETAHHHHAQKWQDKFAQKLTACLVLLTFIRDQTLRECLVLLSFI